MDKGEKNRYEKWKAVKQILQDRDFEKIGGVPYINRVGWFKIASFFNLSFEIKESERKDVGNGKVIWRYRVRVSGPDNSFSEAEGVASSDEFPTGKTENYISSLAQTRAFTRAISFLCGSGEFSAEEISGELIRPRGETSQTDIVRDQEIVEEWQEKEEELKKEIGEYSDVVLEGEREEILETREEIKLDPVKRSELFAQLRELLGEVGFKTAEERKQFVSRVIGREVQRGGELKDHELVLLIKKLKEELIKRKKRVQ